MADPSEGGGGGQAGGGGGATKAVESGPTEETEKEDPRLVAVKKEMMETRQILALTKVSE